MARPENGYHNAAGESIPGVTSILGAYKESGGLIQWAYKRGRVHEGLARRGLPAPKHLYDERDEAAASGTIAHDMIETFVKGEPLPERNTKPEPVLDRAWNSFYQFCEWLQNSHIKIIHTERSLISEKHQFGGTIDGVGHDAQGRVVLLDWKTSNAIYIDMLMQLAAYGVLLAENDGVEVNGFHLVRLAKETADFSHHYFGELEDAKRGFLLRRELFDIDERLKKRVK